MNHRLRDLAERVELCLVVEKDDDFIRVRPSTIQALFDREKALSAENEELKNKAYAI